MSSSRRRRRAAIGIAAGVAAFAATATLALTRNGGSGLPTPGPEGVLIPHAPALAPVRLLTNGEQINGIACRTSEQALFHIHAHLTIFVRGAARQVPAGIGIALPYQIDATSASAFVAGATCFMLLHTHAPDGIIHTESPIERTYTLGDFFDIWGQPLDREQVGPARGPVTALLNGRVYTGNPRGIPLLAHARIQLEVGKPFVPPERIAFPNGL